MAALTPSKPVDKPVDNPSQILGTIMEFGDLQNSLIPPPPTLAPQVTVYADNDQDQGTARGRS